MCTSAASIRYVHASSYCTECNDLQIVGEEHRLRCAGQLQSVNDLKKFWEDMLCPLIPHTTPTPEPTTQMCADNESDDDGYTNSWALTALPPESGDKVSPCPGC